MAWGGSRERLERESFTNTCTSKTAMHAPPQRLCLSRGDEKGHAHGVYRSAVLDLSMSTVQNPASSLKLWGIHRERPLHFQQ